MLKRIREDLSKIKGSEEFKEFIELNPESYLCSCFLFNEANDLWQFDFYNKTNKKITSFLVTDKIEKSDEDEVFRKDKEDLTELKLDDIKIDLDKAFEIFETRNKEKYENEEAEKKIVILQFYKSLIWNITYITKRFNVLNIKIDAIKGSIMEESKKGVMNFKV